ncbi:peptidylprolyl isomerase [Photobacterium sp. CCB-ST2H9]|uniref:peptidylprolyl isomerase n=1 Tax=unclassified Photobacterium TaxID=2628852 RepID=UPI002002B2DB|nr:peptidylprolyl isomerase [Photobacterium sp. CCB-ST2H9]UTM57585.1 peptidylprolyl isomerase [Photobacterium sp. CCB-ST2H9]
MKVAKDTVVSLAYQVKTEEGIVVDQSTTDAPLDYLHGHNNLIIGLEKALEGRAVGDKFEVTVAPEEAYGEHHAEMVQRVPAEVFQGVDEITVGMRFLADTDQGPIPVEVTEVDGDEVVVDGNHMLAGQTLTFDVEIVATRAATEEEISHGHIHQAGGCGHDHDHDHDHEGGCCGHDH